MTDSPFRAFIDTNVLVYAHDTSAGAKREQARTLLRDLWESGGGCLSVQVLQEFFVTVTRKVRHPLVPETAALVIANLAHWSVHTPNAADVLEAIDIHRHNDISFWDAMILRSAEVLSCNVVYTEDLNAGQKYGSVQVVDPFAHTS